MRPEHHAISSTAFCRVQCFVGASAKLLGHRFARHHLGYDADTYRNRHLDLGFAECVSPEGFDDSEGEMLCTGH